jgi:hypothetical protein
MDVSVSVSVSVFVFGYIGEHDDAIRDKLIGALTELMTNTDEGRVYK